MFDFVVELGSSVPWIYRGWFFLFSKGYRSDLALVHRKKSTVYKVFDFTMSFIFCIAEVIFLLVIIRLN